MLYINTLNVYKKVTIGINHGNEEIDSLVWYIRCKMEVFLLLGIPSRWKSESCLLLRTFGGQNQI